jgi:hypothetical protein
VGLQKVMQTGAVDEFIPGQVDAVILVVVFDDVALTGLIQFHTAKYSHSHRVGDKMCRKMYPRLFKD